MLPTAEAGMAATPPADVEETMRALHSIDTKHTAAAALLTASAVLLVGCGTRELTDARLQTSANPAAPVAVSCEPTQRAIVRPAVINGAAISQVECVSTAAAAAAPVAYQPAVPAAIPASYTSFEQPAPLENTRLVQQAPVVRQAAPQRVVYQRVPERVVRSPKRSVKKSAIIIGSSAGAGAGVGALVGGKKGALIGALVGGGGATLWDQITRNK